MPICRATSAWWSWRRTCTRNRHTDNSSMSSPFWKFFTRALVSRIQEKKDRVLQTEVQTYFEALELDVSDARRPELRCVGEASATEHRDKRVQAHGPRWTFFKLCLVCRQCDCVEPACRVLLGRLDTDGGAAIEIEELLGVQAHDTRCSISRCQSGWSCPSLAHLLLCEELRFLLGCCLAQSMA